MLKGLDPYLTPDLLYALAQMGHGDQIALVDRNYPAYANGSDVIEFPHASIADVLPAILQVFPVDAFPGDPVIHMLTDDGAPGPALANCQAIWNQAEARTVGVLGVGRYGDAGFYALAKEAFITIRTGETAPFACYLIPKGVL